MSDYGRRCWQCGYMTAVGLEGCENCGASRDPAPVQPDGAPSEPTVEKIKAALRDFNHCPQFYFDDPYSDPCEGMEGCDQCLRNAALSVAKALRSPDGGQR